MIHVGTIYSAMLKQCVYFYNTKIYIKNNLNKALNKNLEY